MTQTEKQAQVKKQSIRKTNTIKNNVVQKPSMKQLASAPVLSKEAETFEKEVNRYINMGAKVRETAIRWMLESYGAKHTSVLEKEFKLPKDYLKTEQKQPNKVRK